MQHRPPRHWAPRAALALTLASTTWLGACSSTPQSVPTGAEPAVADATPNPLDRPMARELERPSAEAAAAPTPPGIEPADLAPIDLAAAPNATLALDEALDRLEPWASPTPPPPDTADDQAKLSAAKRFTEGRIARLDGDSLIAIRLLEDAARLDPAASEPWTEIGEVRLALGDRRGAAGAFERALVRAPGDPIATQRLALLLDDASDRARASWLLAELYLGDLGRLDPAMRYVVPARLGEALYHLGYLTAGATLINEGLADLPDRFLEPTNESISLAALYRRRGDLQLSVGDTYIRLGRPEDAHLAYERAAQRPSLDPAALLARRVYALMVLGRPAHAAALLLDRVDTAHGRGDNTTTALLAYVVEHSDLAEPIAGTVDRIERSLTPAERTLAQADLLNLRASILGPDAARRAALDAARMDPSSESLVNRLLQGAFAESSARAVDVALDLIEVDPFQTDRLARLLLRLDNDPNTWLGFVSEAPEPTPAQLLLEAVLQIYEDEPNFAIVLLEEASQTATFARAADVIRVGLLSRLGQPEEVEAILARLLAMSDEEGRYAAIRALDRRGETDRGVEIIESPAVGEMPPRRQREIDLIHANLLVRQDRPADALEVLDSLIERDPANDEAHLLRILLLAPSRSTHDERALLRAIESLRTARPDSRALQFLRARDAYARGRLPLATRALRELAQEAPDEERVLTLLTECWMKTRAFDEGRDWLNRLIEFQPGVAPFQRSLARLDLEAGEAAATAEELSSWLDRYPGESSIAMLAEHIQRSVLEDPEQADAIAADRLRLGPRTLQNLQQRTLLDIRSGSFVGTADTIAEMARLARKSKVDVSVWARGVTAAMTRAARNRQISLETAARITGLIGTSFDGLTWETLGDRLYLLALSDAEFDTLRSVLRETVERKPEHAVDFYVMAVEGRRSFDMPSRDQVERFRARIEQRTAEALALAELGLADERASESPLLIAIGLDTGRRASDQPSDPNLRRFRRFADATLASAEREEIIDTLFRLLYPSEHSLFFETRRGDSTNPNHRASILLIIADRFAALRDEERADAFGELAVEADPTHTMANNNLGYRLLERDLRLQDARRMIGVAYAAEPDNISVLDSMGWVQYKLGILEDRGDEPGAVPLLRRAVMLVENSRDVGDRLLNKPIVLDHLADALWRSGRTQDAVERWSQALDAANQTLSPETRVEFPQLADETLADIRTLVGSLEAKLRAAREDRQPPVAAVMSTPPSTEDGGESIITPDGSND